MRIRAIIIFAPDPKIMNIRIVTPKASPEMLKVFKYPTNQEIKKLIGMDKRIIPKYIKYRTEIRAILVSKMYST